MSNTFYFLAISLRMISITVSMRAAIKLLGNLYPDSNFDTGALIAFSAADSIAYEDKPGKPSPGYLLNTEWSKTFSIREDGKIIDHYILVPFRHKKSADFY